MAMNVQQESKVIGILDLPSEVIMHICSYDALGTTDIFNLAVSHPTLNEYIFNEDNSNFWKDKYTQKYFIFVLFVFDM